MRENPENRTGNDERWGKRFAARMEKWHPKSKGMSKQESILPPTRRPDGQSCSSTGKKTDRKWSLGGFLRRISTNQQNKESSNEEEITYIPGDMLSKKQLTKRTSKMKSKLGKSGCSSTNNELGGFEEEANRILNSNTEYEKGSRSNLDRGQNMGFNDSLTSRSSKGSLDPLGKNNSRKISNMKARAQAKRERLRGNSSSDDDSHISSQSLMRIRREDSMQSLERSDSCNKKTRGARTERYIKRTYRDDSNSSSDNNKILKIRDLRSNNASVTEYSANFPSDTGKTTQSGRSAPPRAVVCTPNRFSVAGCNRLAPEMEEKIARPKSSFRHSNPDNIYGSLRSNPPANEEPLERGKLLPPEPPPRSSKSRVLTIGYNSPFPLMNKNISPSARLAETKNIRSYSSDNDIFFSPATRYCYRSTDEPRKESRNFNEPPGYAPLTPSAEIIGKKEKYYEDPATRGSMTGDKYPKNFPPRSTYSLPKGVELFSRQKLANCDEAEGSRKSAKSLADEEAERRRSSKNLEDALTELEAIYSSLRLSDENLLDRAEERSMEEYRNKAGKSANSLMSYSETSSERDDFGDRGSRMKDDMAYRRMNKERPASVNGQASLSRISYLAAASPNLSFRESDSEPGSRSGHGTPDLTRDDLLFRSISHANNTLKVIEPQPPFGIPLAPLTGASESDYLHAKPTKYGKTRSLYIPKNEPDIVNDDLAFRNLRKDKESISPTNRNTHIFSYADSLIEPRPPPSPKNIFTFGSRKKRSLSADIYTMPEVHYPNRYESSLEPRPTNPRDRRDSMSKTSQLFDLNDNTSMNFFNSSSNDTLLHLDVNRNRPKSGLNRKTQVYAPGDNFYGEEKRFSDNEHQYLSSMKSMKSTESDSSLDRSYSRRSSTSDIQPTNKSLENIERFTEQEISEYKKLCYDLEKLIQRTADAEAKIRDEDDREVERITEKNQLPSEFDEWANILNEDYESPVQISASDDIVHIETEREDDRSSSLGLSADSEKLPSFSKKCRDHEPDFLSSASEIGLRSNNGSSTDSIYNRFDRLLKEVNDVPFIESFDKDKTKYTPESNLTGIMNKGEENQTDYSNRFTDRSENDEIIDHEELAGKPSNRETTLNFFDEQPAKDSRDREFETGGRPDGKTCDNVREDEPFSKYHSHRKQWGVSGQRLWSP